MQHVEQSNAQGTSSAAPSSNRYQRNGVWWLLVRVDGKRYRESLQTDDVAAAALRRDSRLREIRAGSAYRIQRVRARRSRQLIYFIATESDSAVKIGYTSTNPISRLAALQTGHHEKLRLIAVTEGDEAYERQLHSIFEDDRLEGEWFRPSEYLQATIKILGDAPSKPKKAA
jgi:hypothetical protein